LQDYFLDRAGKIRSVNEELTRELPDGQSFEERVFARFDAMEARLEKRFGAIDERFDGVNTRLQALEAKALDTKPIWERALAEILEVRHGVEDLSRKIDVLTHDVLQVRADQRRVEKRMDELGSRAQ
jgi:DNA repair exonuclease SbcCD ATPase subunit